MRFAQFLTALAVTYVLIACTGNEPQFTVEGTIKDADSTVLYLEKRELNQTVLLDSVVLDSKGNFSFKETSTLYPEFYVLRLNNEVINFAMDSTETLKIDASKKDFATNYNVEGSLANQQIKSVVLAQYKASREINDIQTKFANKTINEEEYIAQIQTIVNEYKETAQEIIVANFKSPASYFALFQKVNGYLLFDPYDKQDNKIFAAVANSWNTFYLNSPRTPNIREYTLIAMKTVRQSEQDFSDKINELETSEYYNINLPDINAKTRELSSLKGKIVILDFTVFQSENSPAHNIALNNIYTKYKQDLEIYQVSFDADKHYWKNTATNLPWIAVHDDKSVNSDLIFKYNIQALPTVFILDKNGEIVKRLLPTDNIEAEIKKII